MAVIPRLTGEQIADLRKSRNMTQTEFGKIFDVGRRSVCAWEANQWRAPADLYERFVASDVEGAIKETKQTAQDREALRSYSKMRSDGFSHKEIISIWLKGDFTPSQEAQATILAKFPDILNKGKDQ